MRKKPVYVISMGPGAEEYITPQALRAIECAQVLVGGRRWLETTAPFGKEQVPLTGPLEKAIDFIKKERENKRIAVLVSGDAGLYSLLPRLRESLGGESLEVLPGVSSVQLAFARLKMNWEKARVISLHGRAMEGIEKEIATAVVAILCDKKSSPARLAAYLAGKGLGERAVYICERLSYPDEKITETTLSRLGKAKAGDNFLLIIIEEKNGR